jgi:hypothetical protein
MKIFALIGILTILCSGLILIVVGLFALAKRETVGGIVDHEVQP